jgi:hypothetical protein
MTERARLSAEKAVLEGMSRNKPEAFMRKTIIYTVGLIVLGLGTGKGFAGY